MLCHHYKCIFVHIPKTAGQSIEHVFFDLLDLTWETRAPLLLRYNDRPELGPPCLMHLKANEYFQFKYLTQEMFDNYFKFSFVRNPWSRMVSIYMHLENIGYTRKQDFKTFLLGKFKNKIFKEIPWLVGLQSDYLYTRDNKLLVDYVGRFENLQGDFNFVCKEIGISSTQLPHMNNSRSFKDPSLKSRLKKSIRNLPSKIMMKKIVHYADYKEYYDKESIDCVADLYQKDIELFDYNFE